MLVLKTLIPNKILSDSMAGYITENGVHLEKQHRNYLKFGFTLAEVLITLAIIGVVAVMTIPTLISNYREKQRVVQVKKIYAELNQAYMLAVNDYGTPDGWGLVNTYTGVKDDNGNIILDHSGSQKVLDILSKYLKNWKPVNDVSYNVYSLDGVN